MDAVGGAVFGRVMDAARVPRGAPFRISDATPGSQLEPAIAADPSGHFFVTWTSYSPANETLEIQLQRISPTGERLGSPIIVSSHEAGVNRRSPRVSPGSHGDIVVAWQEYARAEREWTIVARELEGSGKPMGPLRVIERSSASYLALERLEASGRGYEVTWQRLLDGHSQGHYRSEVDHRTGSPSRPVLVANQTE
jgi:hypothetical protein